MKPRHILMIGTSLQAPGGMTAVARTLKEAGLFSAFNVRYASTYEGPGLVRQLGVVVPALLRLLGDLMAGRVALLHAHSASRGSFWRKSFFCAMTRWFHVPYVFHIHSGEFPVFYAAECGKLAQWWVRRTLRLAANVICLTESWQGPIKAIEPEAKLVVLGNPVDVPPHLPALRDPALLVLFLGRLREKKGVFDLVRSLPAVLKHCPQLRVVLAGDEGEEKVRAYARDLGVSEAVELPGWVDGTKKQALLEMADIFVLPSYFEGLPVGLLEAMALGIPIITTPVGGIPDFITNEVDGLLVPPGDTVKLASALVRLAIDAKLRQRLREAAYTNVRARYSLNMVLDEIGHLYEKLGCIQSIELVRPKTKGVVPMTAYSAGVSPNEK